MITEEKEIILRLLDTVDRLVDALSTRLSSPQAAKETNREVLSSDPLISQGRARWPRLKNKLENKYKEKAVAGTSDVDWDKIIAQEEQTFTQGDPEQEVRG